jgi:hypothetical protein
LLRIWPCSKYRKPQKNQPKYQLNQQTFK